MITQEFDLNLIPDQEPVIVHVTQYDIGEGRLIAHLYAGDVPYTISNGATVYIQGTKPDNIGFQYDNPTYSGNTVTANLTEQMCAVAGRVVTNIVVTESPNRTGTFNFILDVQKAALSNDTIISKSDGSILDIPILIERAEAAATDAESSASDSEAYATGKRNGEDVESTDPTYHNNSKYYSDISEDYAEESEAWSRGTVGSVDVPSTADQYHNNAKYYSEQADDSAEDAEAWAKGTRDGSAVPSTDPTYQHNSKYYSEEAQRIVDEGNYVVAVNPATVQTPQSPYLRPSDVVDNLTSDATNQPLSANQGRILKGLIDAVASSYEIATQTLVAYADMSFTTAGVTLANGWTSVYVQLPETVTSAYVSVLSLHAVDPGSPYMYRYDQILGGYEYTPSVRRLEVAIYNPDASRTIEKLSLVYAYKK